MRVISFQITQIMQLIQPIGKITSINHDKARFSEGGSPSGFIVFSVEMLCQNLKHFQNNPFVGLQYKIFEVDFF